MHKLASNFLHFSFSFKCQLQLQHQLNTLENHLLMESWKNSWYISHFSERYICNKLLTYFAVFLHCALQLTTIQKDTNHNNNVKRAIHNFLNFLSDILDNFGPILYILILFEGFSMLVYRTHKCPSRTLGGKIYDMNQ